MKIRQIFSTIIAFILVGSIILIQSFGPTKRIPEAHKAYLASYGWHAHKILEKDKRVIEPLHPEQRQALKHTGFDLQPYVGKEVVVTRYLLAERDRRGGKQYAYLYEYRGKIIGGYGIMENVTPGVFSLWQKEQ